MSKTTQNKLDLRKAQSENKLIIRSKNEYLDNLFCLKNLPREIKGYYTNVDINNLIEKFEDHYYDLMHTPNDFPTEWLPDINGYYQYRSRLCIMINSKENAILELALQTLAHETDLDYNYPQYAIRADLNQ